MPRVSEPKKAPARKKAAAKPKPDDDSGLDDLFADLDETIDYANVLLYGREGSAKTTSAAFMANLPGNGKVLVINAEGGLKKKALQKRGVDTSRIVVWPNPKNPQPISGASINEVYRRIKADLDKDPESWAGVIVDSASDVYVHLLDVAQGKRIKSMRNRGLTDIDEDFVDIADYGNMSKAFRDVMRKFRDLPAHFVVTALERRDVDKDTGKPQYGPAVTPALQTDLLGYVDFVIMTKAEDEDGPFRGLTRANSRYRAKDRFDVLPRIMAEPTFDRICQYLTDELTEDTDPLQKLIKSKTKKAQDKDADEDETEDSEADDADEDDD